MQIFYTPDINAEIYTLSVEESRHAVQVLRMKAGDRLHLIDGRGGLYEAEVVEPSAKGCVVRVVVRNAEYGKRPYTLHVAMAPTKNIDRFEWFLEKATEIGIDAVTPLLCQRSERKVVKRDRSEKVVLSAAKQSLKAYVPTVEELTPFEAFVKQDFGNAKKFIAHCEDDRQQRRDLFEMVRGAGEYVVLIGPEGDFSPQEVEQAVRSGFSPVTLGESRLRTETAGVMAAAMVAIGGRL